MLLCAALSRADYMRPTRVSAHRNEQAQELELLGKAFGAFSSAGRALDLLAHVRGASFGGTASHPCGRILRAGLVPGQPARFRARRHRTATGAVSGATSGNRALQAKSQ